MSILRTAFYSTAATLSTLFLSSAVRAQMIIVSPLVIEVQENRGQAQGLINITNETENAFRARVYAEPFTYDRDRGFQTLASSPNDLRPYLQFSPRELTVPGGITRRIRFFVRFPPGLENKEYRSVLFTENLQESTTINSDNTAVNVTSRIGVIVYARKGDLAPKLEVKNANWDSTRNQIRVLVENSGGASVATSADWTLKQGNAVIQAGQVSPTTVIAETERYLLLNAPAQQDTTLAPGNYQLSGELTWNQNNQVQRLPFDVNLTVPVKAATR